MVKRIILVLPLILFALRSFSQIKETDSIEIRIMVPMNIDSYIDTMTSYMNNGGLNPSYKWPFITRPIRIPHTTHLIKASAEAAAEVIPPLGGPAKAAVVYLKLKNKIAYVLLNIDVDGWAGVSYSVSKIHPLVEKTLLQFPQVRKVIFNEAPGETKFKY